MNEKKILSTDFLIKVIVVVNIFILFSIYFSLVMPVAKNDIIASAIMIPIIVCSWIWGGMFGVMIAFLTPFVVTLNLFITDPSSVDPFRIGPIVGTILNTFIAIVVGSFSSLNKKLRHEIIERKRIEGELKNYQNHLEEMVQKRTQELNTINERLRQVEKLEAIGQLAGGVAHDFNNQLTIVLGYCELLTGKLKSSPQLVEYIQHIYNSGKRASELTKQLLAFARKGTYKSQAVNMNDLVKEIVTLLSRSMNKNIAINHFLGAIQPFVWGGAAQLQNALLNLAINAGDAMEKGGTLTIETKNLEIDESYCKNNGVNLPSGKYITISVSDTGIGMDNETMKRIFEPFFTTKEEGKGTGMGLAAVYGIVNSHKGAVIVRSVPGQGSIFTLHFPVTSKIPTSATIISNNFQKKYQNGLHILVIDDEAGVAKMIKDMLESFGYLVTIALSGREGLEIYKEMWKEIDAVIIDMVMPEMNGRETFLALKKINPQINALISSGHALTSDVNYALKEGVRAFLQKPYNKNELAMNIQYLIESQKSVSSERENQMVIA